ncbi:DNA alkylation repair protein [Psychrobium sp. nBUS_13]|uniref:DNA alkylation repair protein n=1 Tax=Psychrobium sp. nBUS_13 TaxID=3395319 RepID=UPI003EBAFE87
MKAITSYIQQISQALIEASTPEKSKSSQRYFPQGFQCLGATAPDIKLIISRFHDEHSDLTPNEVLYQPRKISDHF